MTIDARILLGADSGQLPDPWVQAENVVKLSDLRRKSALAQRADEDDLALRSVLGDLHAGGYSDSAIRSAIAKAPQASDAIIGAALKVRKERAEIGHKEADTAGKQADTGGKVWGLFGQLAGSLADDPTPENYRTVRANAQVLTRFGLPPEVIDQLNPPPGVDPKQHLTMLANSAITRAQQLEVRDRGLVRGETNRHNVAGELNQAGTLAENVRYHGATETYNAARLAEDYRRNNLVDARARELATATAGGGTPAVITVNGVPTQAIFDRRSGTYVDANTKQPITSGIGPDKPAATEKALTEDQGKATAFAMRMQRATATINKLTESGEVDPSGLNVAMAGSTGKWTGAAQNTVAGVLNPKSQVYKQAQKDWVTANLRKESGAVINDAEMVNEINKWFPVFGDGQDVIDEKSEARKVAEQAMLIQAGPGAKNVGAKALEPSAAPASGQGRRVVDSLPDPKKSKGKRARSLEDGVIYRSNGTTWVKE